MLENREGDEPSGLFGSSLGGDEKGEGGDEKGLEGATGRGERFKSFQRDLTAWVRLRGTPV